MSSVMPFLWVALGGAMGAMMRYGVSQAALRSFGSGFPIGTLAVNVLGSFAMGLLIAWFTANASPNLKLFLTTGLLGGFTTFSAFSLDAITLFERGETGSALFYVIASVAVSIAAAALGVTLGRAVFS